MRPSIPRICFSLVLLLVVSPHVFAQFFIRDTTFLSILDTAGTSDVDLTSIPNRVILLTGTNTNLALNKSISVIYRDPTKISIHPTASNPQLMIDGRVSSSSFFELLPGQEGTQIRIDLQATRVINRVVTRVFPANSVNFRVRGYSIYVGLDTLSYKKVKQIVDNELANTNDFFEPDTARYVLLRVDKQDPSLQSPFSTTFGEIEIYGIGYLAKGTFASRVRDVGITVNWSTASWKGNLPSGTAITFQARTGDSPTVESSWSSWSDEVVTPNSSFDVHEPRRYIQYRMNLYTFSIQTPRLDEVTVNYDTALVVRAATAKIVPQTTQILQEALLTYQISTQTDTRSTGIDTLVLFTSVPLVVTGVTVNDLNVSNQVTFRPGRVAVAFGQTVNINATINVTLKFTPFLDQTRLPSAVISRLNPANPQRVDANIADGIESWTLLTTGVPERVIVDAEADPNPFTPNGDGLNDQTKFSFFISNLVLARPAQLKIYDVTGRIVRTLLDTKTTAQAFVEQNAIPWDGRDDLGRLLPPGLYIYQIVVEADGLSPAAITKTVTIAY